MAIERNSKVLRYIGAIFGEGIATELTDRQLLERFTSRPNESAELACTALVERHGPMVLRVCRAALRDEHDAQDAFQAVFLVLVQKAGSLWVGDSLGPWLHGVALRVSASARDSAIRRRIHERRHAQLTLRTVPDQGKESDDLGAVVHEEVGRLPKPYRTAVVLCDLEGLTHEEAARRLGLPVGTVKSRQARGRERLRGRLIRRGLAQSAGGVAVALAAERATAAVPSSLVMSTVKLTVLVAKGSTPAGLISTATVVLTNAVLKAMFLHRLRMGAGVISVLVAVITTAGLAIHRGAAVEQARAARGNVAAKVSIKVEPPQPLLDALRAADIPAEKRLADQPENVVAVLGELRGRHAGEVRCLAVSRDGKLLATGADQDKNVRLWDAETLRPQGALIGHRASVNCVTISPDGHWLASGSAYGDFLLWDLSTSPPKGPTFLLTRGHQGKLNNQIHAAAFTKDSKRLAVAGDGHSVGLFDFSGPEPVERGVLLGLSEEVRSLTFSPDGKTLALAGLQDGSVRLWDMTGNAPRARVALTLAVTVVPHANGSISVAFSPDGKTLATLAKDGGVRLWDLSKEEPVNRGRLVVRTNEDDGAMIGPGGQAMGLPAPDQRRVGGIPILANGLQEQAMVAFAPDGKTLAMGGNDHKVRLWDLTGDQPEERLVLNGNDQWPPVVAISSKGDRFAFSGPNDSIRLCDLAAAEPSEQAQLKGTGRPISSLVFSPDDKTLASGSNGGTQLWDLSGGTPKAIEPLIARLGPAFYPIKSCMGFSMLFSLDGKWLIAADQVSKGSWQPSKPAVCVYELASGKRLHEWDLSVPCWAIALAPDGRHVAAAQRDGVTLILRLPAAPGR